MFVSDKTFYRKVNIGEWYITNTAQKMKFSITDFLSKCDQKR